MYEVTETHSQTSIDELMDFLSSNEESFPSIKNFIEDYKLDPSTVFTPSGINAIKNRLDASKEFVKEAFFILDSLSIISIKHHGQPSYLYEQIRDMIVTNRMSSNMSLVISEAVDEEFIYRDNLSIFIDSNRILIAIYLISYVYYITF